MSLDESLLLWINQGWGGPFLDVAFVWLSSRNAFAFPLLGVLLFWAWHCYGTDGIKLWLLTVLTVALGDAFGNQIKHLTDQYRPCYEIYEALRARPGAVLPCGSNTAGMPSNHALNFFAAAVLLAAASRLRPITFDLLLVATAVALSRVYLGKHYPSQVLAGALLGALLGAGAFWLANRSGSFMQRIRTSERARRP